MKNLFWCILIIVAFPAAGVFAQTNLDPAFGASGRSVVIANFLAFTEDMAVQPDNKIILASSCRTIDNPQVPFCLTRMNEDGSIDGTFSGGGNPVPSGVFTTFSGGSGMVRGIAIQNDGKVIAVGTGPGNGGDVVLVRYNSDGSLDSSFGTAGIVFTTVTGAADSAEKAALQPDGKIVVVGYGGSDQFAARYLPDGTLDKSFGTGGIFLTSLARGSSIALQSDGKIVSGGSGGAGGLLARFNSDGTPDPSWNGSGVLSVSGSGGFRSIGIQADGRVTALGTANIIYRFNPDGSPDTSFDGDGSRAAFSGTNKTPYSISVSASGKITVVGTGIPPACSFGFPCPDPGLRFFTMKYAADGSPDQSYGVGGSIDVNVGGSYDGARAVSVDSVGRTVVAGVSSNCCIRTYWETPRFSAIRILAPEPRPVSVSGRVTDANGNGVSGVTVSTQSGLSTRTSPFGFYTLNNVETNRTYVFSVRSKTDMAFGKRTILVDDQVTGLDFIGEQFDTARSKSR